MEAIQSNHLGTRVQNHFFSDMSVMIGRSMRHVFRSADTIITCTVMPVATMVLFVYVFGGAIQTGMNNYVNYLLPGILIFALGNSIGYTSFRLFNDIQRGIFERFHSMPIARSAALWGHALTSLASYAISVVATILIGLLMGFRPSAGIGAWLLILGILALFALALTWIAIIPGLTAKSTDGATGIAYPIHLLPVISSAFVPTKSMPLVVRIFADYQPVTPVVNTIRELLFGQPVGNELWAALAWSVGILVVAYVFAMRAYKKRVS